MQLNEIQQKTIKSCLRDYCENYRDFTEELHEKIVTKIEQKNYDFSQEEKSLLQEFTIVIQDNLKDIGIYEWKDWEDFTCNLIRYGTNDYNELMNSLAELQEILRK